VTCPCGCPLAVKPGNTYATAGCAGRVRFRVDSPQMRAWKRKAGAESGRKRHRQIVEEVRGLTPVQAFALGLKLGFNRAEKRWKRWAERYVRGAAA
jgi:hypothetical protein